MPHARTTEVSEVLSEIEESYASAARAGLKRRVRVAGWIGLAIVPGSMVGMAVGIANANGDAGRLAVTDAKITDAHSQLGEDRANFANYLLTLPESCRTSLSTYLRGGANQYFPTPQAQISLQESHTCPPAAVTTVADARKLRHAIREDRLEITQLERKARSQQADAKSDIEIVTGALFGGLAEAVAAAGVKFVPEIVTNDTYYL